MDIIPSLITGGLSLIGVLITNILSNRKVENEIKTQQAVVNTKIDNLTREVREHNNFAKRVPVLEEQMNHVVYRIEKIERKG